MKRNSCAHLLIPILLVLDGALVQDCQASPDGALDGALILGSIPPHPQQQQQQHQEALKANCNLTAPWCEGQQDGPINLPSGCGGKDCKCAVGDLKCASILLKCASMLGLWGQGLQVRCSQPEVFVHDRDRRQDFGSLVAR
mmetsp:Transcript_61520/g.110684  ORF Transcript_61520/g.110684 Transcript_61520/m.110684 type:complete len:141 (-) Transcript_61520:396-818(-)